MKPDFLRNVRSVLMPTDFSAGAERALPVALHLSERLGADLHLLHVVCGDDDQQARRRLEALRLDYRYCLPSSRPSAIRPTVLHAATAKEGILRYAALAHADLIVMAHRGHSFDVDSIPGSTTLAVMLEAPSPVLAVPFGAELNAPVEHVLVLGPSPLCAMAHRLWDGEHVAFTRYTTPGHIPRNTNAGIAVLPSFDALADPVFSAQVCAALPRALLLSPPRSPVPVHVPA